MYYLRVTRSQVNGVSSSLTSLLHGLIGAALGEVRSNQLLMAIYLSVTVIFLVVIMEKYVLSSLLFCDNSVFH